MTIITKTKILALCLLLLFGGSGSLRGEELSQEYQLKLAFMVNFARFISWPETAFSPAKPQLHLCVLGKNPFGNALDGVTGKKVGDRVLAVKSLQALNKEQQCHLLFVDQSEVDNFAGMGVALKDQPVVTVSDSPGFAAAGGAIEFVIKDAKLAFVINNTAMKERGVQAGSALLNLAVSVR